MGTLEGDARCPGCAAVAAAAATAAAAAAVAAAAGGADAGGADAGGAGGAGNEGECQGDEPMALVGALGTSPAAKSVGGAGAGGGGGETPNDISQFPAPTPTRKRRYEGSETAASPSSNDFMAVDMRLFNAANHCHLARRCSGFVSDDLIRRLPKADLHLHLDGSIRLATLIDLAKEHNITLPAYTVEGLKETVFKKSYADLTEYLQGFFYMDGVLQTPCAVERVAYELACDNFDEGVRYFEVRFAPHLHTNDTFSCSDVVRSVNRGLQRAKAEYNANPAVVDGSEPHFEYAMILIAMRYFTSGFSQYFQRLAQVHPDEERNRLYELASSSLARAAVALHEEGLPIVALDIAGAEAGFPAKTHKEAFDYCHRHFLRKTVHAGEAFGPDSIFQAITSLHADRIGHGTNVFRSDLLPDDVGDKHKYCFQLANHLADRSITVECCLTSNLQTKPELKHDAKNHPLRQMLDCHMCVCLNTDNRTVSDTTMCREICLARDAFALNPRELRHLIFGGFRGCFYPGPCTEKNKYLNQILEFYDKIEHESILRNGCGNNNSSGAGAQQHQ